MLRPAFVASVALMLLTATPALYANTMGTAGLYRSITPENCSLGVPAQMQGACDPAPVDETLPVEGKIKAHLARAERLVLLLRMPQAREAADQALALDPNSFAALKFRTRLALNMSDDNTAWRDVNAALKITPDDSDLLANKAELRFRRQEPALAVQDATAAVKADPGNTDALRIRGRILMITGKAEDAMADWNRALELEPDFKLARMFRAQTFLRMANFNAAIEDATIILRDDSHDMSTLQVRAYAYGGLGKFEEAVDDLNVLLGKPGDNRASSAMNRDHRPMLLQRMIMLFKLGREDEGQQDIDMLLTAGGKQGVLQLQLFLRKNGYPYVELDGRRSGMLDKALLACTSDKTCLQALTERI